MDKMRMAGFVTLVIALISLLGIPQGYAKNIAPPGAPSFPFAPIGSVTNPSGTCTNLGLAHGFGTVSVARHGYVIYLHNVDPHTSFSVSVGYLQNGVCDGTWQSVGPINTNSSGAGTLQLTLSLTSGHKYVFEFKDSAGTLIYASSSLTI